MNLETLATHGAHGGVQGIYRHASAATGRTMTFAVFVPPQARDGPCPVVTFLSGLTCTHANVVEKGEYRRAAAELGLIVVCPDTSPRGDGVPDDEAYDFGQGAGFYLDALRAPWATNFRMESYVLHDLPAVVAANFPADMARQGITGHSMGGHGALTLALKHPGRWKSVSALAPIASPMRCPWGEKALTGYLGEDRAAWRRHDATALIEDGGRLPALLVHQGGADDFLQEQLKPELLQQACEAAGQPLTFRLCPGYDHSYYFVSTFMAEHLAWHAERLG
jgi:S-formylglutathione hydrolase